MWLPDKIEVIAGYALDRYGRSHLAPSKSGVLTFDSELTCKPLENRLPLVIIGGQFFSGFKKCEGHRTLFGEVTVQCFRV